MASRRKKRRVGEKKAGHHLAPHRSARPGAPPGTLTPPPDAAASRLTAFRYASDGSFEEQALHTVEDVRVMRARGGLLWLDVVGLGDAGLLKALGQIFALHPLALEDVVNVHQRPKVEAYEDHLFCVLRMVRPGAGLELEQLSLALGEEVLVTFQEQEGDCLEPVRERLRRRRGGLRAERIDQLAHGVIDTVVDHYFPVVERLADRLEQLEDRILAGPGREALERIQRVRRDLAVLRRAVWPMREVLHQLSTQELQPWVRVDSRVFFRDAHDHALLLTEAIDACRETSSELREAHGSALALRDAEATRVLTVIATIFIPLSFIAGVYGMNFSPDSSPWNMPELRWGLGYPFALLLMLLTASGFLVYFVKRGFLGAIDGKWIPGKPRRRVRTEPSAEGAGEGVSPSPPKAG